MFKTFTLTRKEEEQLSETDGKMTFHLTDESGFERNVSGFFGKINNNKSGRRVIIAVFLNNDFLFNIRLIKTLKNISKTNTATPT